MTRSIQSFPHFTLVVNAGGESRRMGQPKPLLPVPPHNQPLIAHIIQRLGVLPIEEIIVVTNDLQLPQRISLARPITYLPDAHPDTGALGGIATALAHCPDWAILVACDMPMVNPAIFKLLCQIAAEIHSGGESRWDAVVPRVNDYAQTFHALYHRRCLPAILNKLTAGQRRVTRFYSNVRVRWVDEEEIQPLDTEFCSFLNVNTPEEWNHVVEILQD